MSLTPELEKFVLEKVKMGRYLSASEVVRETLRPLQEIEVIRVLSGYRDFEALFSKPEDSK
ncbi:MAG: type II toxin-antitoxin system ParD family antitoxin [Microcoleus vaginatus WJT46-NPBG5]|nr:type II toxin-antitoxin system ParD family antitoxin [Microcoleus vaginatus WJT46-NPBG5]